MSERGDEPAKANLNFGPPPHPHSIRKIEQIFDQESELLPAWHPRFQFKQSDVLVRGNNQIIPETATEPCCSIINKDGSCFPHVPCIPIHNLN
jgi:hypothetical protein